MILRGDGSITTLIFFHCLLLWRTPPQKVPTAEAVFKGKTQRFSFAFFYLEEKPALDLLFALAHIQGKNHREGRTPAEQGIDPNAALMVVDD
jgi:hypothetical protein